MLSRAGKARETIGLDNSPELSLSEIEGISDALSDLAGSEAKDSRITWRIRRIVLKREE